ncbi:hypothetical protein AALO_G00287310 [Alosa alosa]|uniref:PDZ domain-containing protein n=1 Tax=Alosa alosa TaxID=278164 RepID=A0AAV6FKU5_9TELE|nr:hypothetical protein AALO_G00287310 [Alosa alosa]
MAMQESQTGPVFCSIYIHYQLINGENHYKVVTAVGNVRSGDIEPLKKGFKLVKLNDKDLLGATSEQFFKLLSGSQGEFSLTITEDHGATDNSHQGDSSNTFEETTLTVTLQDAKIDLLCTDCDDRCILESQHLYLELWECKSIRLANKGSEYLGWTAVGPGFNDTGEKITMLKMDKHVVLQFPGSFKFLTCEKEREGTFTLKAEKNDKLKDLLSDIVERKVPHDKNNKKILEDNRSFFFHLTINSDNTYTFESALYQDRKDVMEDNGSDGSEESREYEGYSAQ